MAFLLLTGFGLLVFGGIVLLRYPDKPGGKIAIGTLEVSSLGAGLPLIALGVACILAFARTDMSTAWLNYATSNPATPSSANSCFDQFLSNIPAERQHSLEVGTHDKTILAANQIKTTPIALLFTENRETIGAMTFNVFPEDDLFKVDTIIDAQCQPITQFENASRGGNKAVLQNWDTLKMSVNTQSYVLRLGYSEGNVEVNSFSSLTP